MRYLDRLLSIIIPIFFTINSIAQTPEREEVYGTNTGNLKIIAVVDDTLLRARTDNLIVIINYQTAEFELILDKSELMTENDSLNTILERKRGERISMTGHFDLPFIKREKHPPIETEFTAYLSTDEARNPIQGTARFEYLFNGRYSDMLTMNFIIDVRRTGIPITLPGLEPKVEIEIRKAVLNNPVK